MSKINQPMLGDVILSMLAAVLAVLLLLAIPLAVSDGLMYLGLYTFGSLPLMIVGGWMAIFLAIAFGYVAFIIVGAATVFLMSLFGAILGSLRHKDQSRKVEKAAAPPSRIERIQEQYVSGDLTESELERQLDEVMDEEVRDLNTDA